MNNKILKRLKSLKPLDIIRVRHKNLLYPKENITVLFLVIANNAKVSKLKVVVLAGERPNMDHTTKGQIFNPPYAELADTCISFRKATKAEIESVNAKEDRV